VRTWATDMKAEMERRAEKPSFSRDTSRCLGWLGGSALSACAGRRMARGMRALVRKPLCNSAHGQQLRCRQQPCKADALAGAALAQRWVCPCVQQPAHPKPQPLTGHKQLAGRALLACLSAHTRPWQQAAAGEAAVRLALRPAPTPGWA